MRIIMRTAMSSSNQGIFSTPIINWGYLAILPFFAIATGLFVYNNPSSFDLVLTLDLWLLGYHHLISTFSRIAFDKKSMKENWFYLIPLPLMVLAAILGLYYFKGAIIIATVYIYWQWYHYSRQSEGVSKAYGMKSQNKMLINHKLNRLVFYTTPLVCFLWMVSRDNNTFLGMTFLHIYIPEMLRNTLLIFSLGLTILWLINAVKWLVNKQITLYYFVYMLGHFSIYYVSYILIDNLTIGWLTINIWHNVQYIGIVWLFNRNKYKAGVEKEHFLISYLSQPNKIFMYMLVFLLLTFTFYGGINKLIYSFPSGLSGLPLVLIVYATLNFHHYIIDSQIWKLRKKAVSQNLC